MDSNDYKELISQMAYKWAIVKLPSEGLAYSNYIYVVGELLTATQDAERAEYLFRAVLEQAIELNKSSRWVVSELRFEALAEAVDRTDLLLLYLKQAEPITDDALDLYNERLNRFKTNG